jgi:hypothetical protein
MGSWNIAFKSRSEMRKITPVVLGLILAFLAQSESLAQKVKTVDGVTVVSNGKKPVPVKGQPVKIKLAEELTVGGSANPDESLSQVSTFVVDGEGGILALDFKEQKIKVFDRTGKLLRLIGKPGQGPGELGIASGIQLMADNTLVVEDATNRRLALFKPSGEFIKNISTSDKLGLVNILLDGKGNVIGREMGLAEGNAKMFFEIKKFDANLKPLFTLDKIEFPVPIPGSGTKMNILEMMSGYQFDPAGNIYYGRNADYEIKIYSPEGKHVRTIQKEYDRVKVTQTDIDEMLEKIPNTMPGVNIKEMFSFPEYFPPYQFFLLDDRGRLYVRTFTKGKAKGEYEIDVFDAEGKFFAQFITKSDLRLWKDGKAYGIEETDEGYQVIKRYSVLTE